MAHHGRRHRSELWAHNLEIPGCPLVLNLLHTPQLILDCWTCCTSSIDLGLLNLLHAPQLIFLSPQGLSGQSWKKQLRTGCNSQLKNTNASCYVTWKKWSICNNHHHQTVAIECLVPNPLVPVLFSRFLRGRSFDELLAAMAVAWGKLAAFQPFAWTSASQQQLATGWARDKYSHVFHTCGTSWYQCISKLFGEQQLIYETALEKTFSFKVQHSRSG